ncbi:glomulin [Musca vetustissima]|uniref:glomulin n=1 Tax=Musca vetustissima TaxID=27455 RepID=UPI002AB7E149|nr:glomulin [Musca vetustissima]
MAEETKLGNSVSEENDDEVSFDKPAPPTEHGENLKALVKQLIKERQYEGVALLFTTANEAPRNVALLREISIDLYNEVCKDYLTEEVYQQDPELFVCAEELLKTMAANAPPESLLLELLELVEENMFERVFNSALRAMQVVLLRLGDRKSMSLQWALQSIWTRLAMLPEPEYLYVGYDEKEKHLLEQDEDVQNILMHYITLDLFYQPLIADICSKPRLENEIFRNCQATNNRRNIMCCFLIDVMGNPFSLLDLSNQVESKTNTYSLQCARSLVQGVIKCVPDPYFFLSFVETKARWKLNAKEHDGLIENKKGNIFLSEDEMPLENLAIFYYLVIAEGIGAAHVPRVYNPMYVCEMSIYLAQELLKEKFPALHDKALKLVEKSLQNLANRKIPSSDLDLEIHKVFCKSLCHLVGFSSQTHIRQNGIKVLHQYILSFDDEGKYLILKNLMATVNHQGLCGYLGTMYKDLVAEALKASSPLPTSFAGQDFRTIFLQNICKLPQGVETDLIENSDKIISTLNALRFFALKDAENRTGFWSFAKDIEDNYLIPLRKGLNLSEAHYKGELKKVQEGRDTPIDMEQLKMLDVAVENDSTGAGLDLQLSRDKKIELLNQNLCTFDLIRSLLGRVCECFDNAPKDGKTTTTNDASNT